MRLRAVGGRPARRLLVRIAADGPTRVLSVADAELHPPDGMSLQAGRYRIEGTQLEGHAPASSLQAFLPNKQITGDRAVAEWVVRAPRGTRVALTASADRAGTVRTEVTLD